ncbi:MAG: hypothetical protein HYZ48_01360 [Chlamydiales bacterium]|nr:hypothetical protein [Chlamydiales bacterium]
MGSVGQIAASIPSILANGALTAGMGALACAAGAALGSTALPSIAGGAIAIGSQTIIGRTVSVILHETDCGKQIPLGIRAITGLAMFPISIFAGAAIATAAGIPVTFSARHLA